MTRVVSDNSRVNGTSWDSSEVPGMDRTRAKSSRAILRNDTESGDQQKPQTVPSQRAGSSMELRTEATLPGRSSVRSRGRWEILNNSVLGPFRSELKDGKERDFQVTFEASAGQLAPVRQSSSLTRRTVAVLSARERMPHGRWWLQRIPHIRVPEDAGGRAGRRWTSLPSSSDARWEASSERPVGGVLRHTPGVGPRLRERLPGRVMTRSLTGGRDQPCSKEAAMGWLTSWRPGVLSSVRLRKSAATL
ncbi:unnamed protein product [Rangifer tarandus platyrhynchus]|uniref:Uncharacterized protein n=2 Tax=Rangifer tarandus platyrhynchus TaxID=3082113 RepID=A0ABN8ZIT3_RANTA|nr:unnamed protein product [Rangifer tarandus platyrhynchus]CAI9708272.1 unnamed protein product [Rangifer tarandus platyrhynchus]